MSKTKLKETPALPWLSESGRKIWPVVVENLTAAGVDAERYSMLVGLLCDLLAEYVELGKPTPSMSQSFVNTGVRRVMRRRLIEILAELGASPASELRIRGYIK